MANQGKELNLAIIGGGGVGKSCMTVQYVSQEWDYDETYDPTIEDTWRKKVNIDGNMIVLSILDTAGQDEYVALVRDAMKNADGIILVFDVTAPASLKKLEAYLTQLFRAKEEEYAILTDDDSFNSSSTKVRSTFPPIVLAGNKCDLKEQRKVTTEESLEFARNILNFHEEMKTIPGTVTPAVVDKNKKKGTDIKLGIPYFETSAKTRTNIDECFEEAIRQTLRWKSYLEAQLSKESTGESTPAEEAPAATTAQPGTPAATPAAGSSKKPSLFDKLFNKNKNKDKDAKKK